MACVCACGTDMHHNGSVPTQAAGSPLNLALHSRGCIFHAGVHDACMGPHNSTPLPLVPQSFDFLLSQCLFACFYDVLCVCACLILAGNALGVSARKMLGRPIRDFIPLGDRKHEDLFDETLFPAGVHTTFWAQGPHKHKITDLNPQTQSLAIFMDRLLDTGTPQTADAHLRGACGRQLNRIEPCAAGLSAPPMGCRCRPCRAGQRLLSTKSLGSYHSSYCT